jgi:hypothetical protein
VKRRSLTLLVLAAALAILAAVTGIIAWHPWSPGGVNTQAADDQPPVEFVTISEIDQNQVKSVQLVSASGTIELVRSRNTWEMAKPGKLDVKPGPVQDLLYSISNLASERVIEEQPESLEPYGLDIPIVTVRIMLNSGEVRELYLGDMTPAADSYYLMAGGDPRVFTVREHHGAYFSYGIPDFWVGSRKPIDPNYIVALKIVKQEKPVMEIASTIELYRNDVEFRGTTFSVVYPWTSSPKAVDLNFLTSFVGSLTSLNAEVAVDANPADKAKYGLDRPFYELMIQDGHGETLHIFAGKQDGEMLYLQFAGDPAVYAGDPRLLSLLEVDPFAFVSKYAVIVDIRRVDSLTITSGNSMHVLEIRRETPGSEEGADWLVDGRAIDVKTFKDFYVFAISLQIDAFYEDERTPVSAPVEAGMTFGLKDGPVSEFIVEFVPYSQEFYAVQKNGKGGILVNRQQVKALMEELDKLVQTTVAD